MFHLILLVGLGALAADPAAPRTMLLWPQGVPDAVGQTPDDRPTLTIHTPAPGKANGTAVVVCPGGGYQHLAKDHEGRQPAEWLNERGITAVVLYYRHAPRYRHPTPLADAQRALRTVRARASEWGVDPRKIGIWGFSAGGHLASSTGTHFDAGNPQAKDPVERVSCRPDFLILCYPVITFSTPATHAGSKKNLLGESPDPQLVELMSNEKQVTAQTPPTFLFHTDADRGVPPENSVLFYLALKKARVPAELHIYEQGPHGVGLALKDPVLSSWPGRLADWLQSRGLIPPAAKKS